MCDISALEHNVDVVKHHEGNALPSLYQSKETISNGANFEMAIHMIHCWYQCVIKAKGLGATTKNISTSINQ